jgi:SAM-dependent methyltransferase
VIAAGSERACPLCGASEASSVREASFDAARLGTFSFASRKRPELMHWRLVTCASCGLVYASPAPAEDVLLGAYRDAAFDAAGESRDAARTYASVVARVLPDLPDRAGALDVGAGDGAFLERLLELCFFGVVGLEPSEAARRGAPEHVRGLIRDEPFAAKLFAEGSFSLVTCLQTIEHVPEPLALCREAHRLLQAGGAFVVVCHDRRAAPARLLGRRSPIYDVEHLQLFDRRTIRALLERSGFEGIQVHTLVNRYPLRYWLRLARAPQALVRLLGPLASIPLIVPAGNLWVVGYRPRGSE